MTSSGWVAPGRAGCADTAMPPANSSARLWATASRRAGATSSTRILRWWSGLRSLVTAATGRRRTSTGT
eukprot:10533799-Alexandrium_andersonii.AAC.1